MKGPDSELRRLTDVWHEGTISREELGKLEERLLSDSESREYFFEISELEAALAEVASNSPSVVVPIRASRMARWWKMAAVFAIGAFSGAMILKLTPAPVTPATLVGGPDATITGMMGVAWDGHAGSRSVDLSPDGKETKMGSGLMELTFGSGTRAVVEGPASFQILGANSMALTYGKVVADVPKGAEGFSVSYAEGKIVDLGTEFGIEIGRTDGTANFGVFRGEIEFQSHLSDHKPVRLLENHAIVASENSIQSVPFDQSKFTRKLPSREFSWEVKASGPDAMTWDYEVSHLIWKSGRYRAICKWMKGENGVELDGAELLLDGVLIAKDMHPGFAGIKSRTKGNDFQLEIPSGHYRRGLWTLRLHVRADRSSPVTNETSGVVLVEDGLALNAKAEDFVGSWEYLHDGKVFRRTYLADGTATLLIDGTNYPTFASSHWSVADGILTLNVQEGTGEWVQERQVLRNPDNLIFTNCPYRDARRMRL